MSMDQETRRALNDLGQIVTRNAAEHNKLAHVVQRSHQGNASEQMIDSLIKIVSATYEKAVAYTNVILVAGYASFFALWVSTKPVLPGKPAIAAILLMTFSVTIFVFFELYKMIQHGCFFSRHQRLLADPEALADPLLLQTRIKEFENLQRQEALSHIRVWIVVLWLTIPTALLAIAILAFNYLVLLFGPGR
jgi:hypothetical protein